jgi:DNA replication protein DnaD
MAFVSFSSQLVLDNTTAVNNCFFEEHLPNCNGDCARVYLYGLYICSSAARYDNTLEHFANTLGLAKEDIISAFEYWHDQGLVQILSVKPIEIKYLPIKQNSARIKKYSKDKYADFNTEIQSVIEGRMITPTEYAEYYAFLESFHVEPAAFIMTTRHCVDLKGANIGYNYILTVAKNWAYAGIKTVEAIEEKLETEKAHSKKVINILKALKLKRNAEPTDFELYNKWTKKLGYSSTVIEQVAKTMHGGINKLDKTLIKYFELKLFEADEIAEYSKTAKDMTALAFTVNRKIGIFYENVETIIEEYLVPWKLKGFDPDTLLAIAGYCFKAGKRTLADMDDAVNRFYKLGIITQKAINEFVHEKVTEDKIIKDLLEKLGQTREVNQFDRDFYKTWTDSWNFSSEIITYAASLSAGKTSPMAYMNKILGFYFENKITDIGQAERNAYTPQNTNITRHSYSDTELKSLFSNIEEIKF